MSDEPVTRGEFQELAEEVHGQARTNLVLLRQQGEVLRLVRAIARLLGIDQNGDQA